MRSKEKWHKWYTEAREVLSSIVFGRWETTHPISPQDKPEAKVPGPVVAERTSEEESEGIWVRVQSMYLPHRSAPEDGLYTFAYTVAITNEGDEPAQVMNRHWIITDAYGNIEEVKGEGVVGEKPRLNPGQTFQYTSGCQLRTPIGTMHGSYELERDDGSTFDAEIAAFSLATPVIPKTMQN